MQVYSDAYSLAEQVKEIGAYNILHRFQFQCLQVCLEYIELFPDCFRVRYCRDLFAPGRPPAEKIKQQRAAAYNT